MSNPFEDSDDDIGRPQEISIKEGLLCPVCVLDFKTISELREHFETNHKNEFNSNTNQTNQISSQLKGFFTKTKRILKNENIISYEDNESMVRNINVSYVELWRQQMKCGQTRSHFDYFRKIRDTRIERYVIETNKLLIRLDKLLTDSPKDPEKRKIHEKSVVVWANDDDVRLCPTCAKSFNLSRRRHHCRLCGGIMCHNCSQFLDFVYARKMISPTNLEESSLLLLPKTSNLTRRGSSSSLLSIMNSSGDPHIRVCKECKVLLNRRDQQIEDNLSKPIITQFYDRMREQIKEVERLTPLYFQMIDSLSLGETNYSLKDTQELRTKLTKLAESVDSISRKIAGLGTQDDPPPHPKQLQLQNAIRLSVTQFLRQTMLGLPTLPTAEELKKLQEQRRIEIEKKIQYEKQLALEEQQKYSSPQRQNISVNNSYSESTANKEVVVSPDGGWTPVVHNSINKRPEPSDQTLDPMLQQINIIRNYIRQARDAHKYDELHMLEENLKELEIEYFVQQHGNENQTNS